MTFVVSHDNQRGHGGGGNLLTHEDPWNYKVGSSFMLAHDYGFKRVMSSYYFSDTDAGPPGSSPSTDCGGGWACEHRWASIGNMVQFTNAVVSWCCLVDVPTSSLFHSMAPGWVTGSEARTCSHSPGGTEASLPWGMSTGTLILVWLTVTTVT